jgi:hypothetical protein
MSRYVDIGELADQVMASVKTASVTKTASAKSTKVRTSAAARELRKFAEDLQQMPDQDDVSDDDLEALMQDQEVQQLLEELQNNPELLQQLLAEQGVGSDDGAGMDPGMDPGMGGDPSMQAGPMGGDPGMDPSMQAASMEGDPSMGAMPPGINPQDPDNDGDAGGDTDGDGDGPKPKKHKDSDDDDDDSDSEKGESKAPPSFAGKTASEIRKIAAYIRDNDKRFKQIRMLKAANMLHAATALKHLTGGSK